MFIPKITKASELTRPQRAFLVSFVRRNMGLKLTVKHDRLWLSRRFLKGTLGAKLQVSRDETVGASLYWAKSYAKTNRLGIYRKGA